MADCGSLDDAIAAESAGADYLGTTLSGYTGERPKTSGPDLELVRLIASHCEKLIVAEGRIHSPADAAAARRAGTFAVCVGTAITHPSTITSWFVPRSPASWHSRADTETAIRRVLISAYAASPAHTRWDAALERELLSGLCALPSVAGLEIPWLGALHPHDVPWFLRNVPAGAQLSLTPLPWVMRRCAADAAYGLASPDSDGRAAAIADLRRVAADVRRLSSDSDATVSFVGLHTAPQGAATPDALARSLDEISSWDWVGAELVVEHCDARSRAELREGLPAPSMMSSTPSAAPTLTSVYG